MVSPLPDSAVTQRTENEMTSFSCEDWAVIQSALSSVSIVIQSTLSLSQRHVKAILARRVSVGSFESLNIGLVNGLVRWNLGEE